ncbi:hypothetical protein GE061_008458 [Apolygus lucorum]|uniref:Uncharacterized protein n=1 Tax=Apolygus lucorum TaxID=248454 RepID=A0A8S9WSA8_APOLU|nr:hypothetical protein GE061_008458 [Apolygus lucorum]
MTYYCILGQRNLSGIQFTDALALRYGQEVRGLPSSCEGCGGNGGFTRGQSAVQLTGGSTRLDVASELAPVHQKPWRRLASTRVSRAQMNTIFRALCSDFLRESAEVLQEELSWKKEWTRKWILRRKLSGASSQLLSELRVEDPREYRSLLRMSPATFDELLHRLTPIITKQDTVMREALSPKRPNHWTANWAGMESVIHTIPVTRDSSRFWWWGLLDWRETYSSCQSFGVTFFHWTGATLDASVVHTRPVAGASRLARQLDCRLASCKPTIKARLHEASG